MTPRDGRLQQPKLSALIGIIAVALAIAFQVQATPTLAGSLIRLSLADLASPLIFIVLAPALALGKLQWPRWSVPYFWAWIGLLSAVLAIALIVGRVKFGFWLPWAVVNKFGGWFVLIWYLLVGGVVAATLADAGKERFLKAFLVFFWVSCAVSIAGFLLNQANIGLPSWIRYNRVEGFMKNPNAFGFLAVVAIAVQLPYAKSNALFSVHVHRLGLALALTALVLTGSRSAWLGAIVAAPFLISSRSIPWRTLVIASFSAALLLAILLFGTPEFFVERAGGYQSISGGYIFNEPMFSSSDRGLAYRLETGIVALGLWLREPLLGAGLGGFPYSLTEAGKAAEVIHNTYLWILTEMGVVGFVVFAAFFVTILRALWQRQRDGNDPRFAVAAIAVMFVFAGVAMGMEAMYQRHLWFILGLALALPAATRPHPHANRS